MIPYRSFVSPRCTNVGRLVPPEVEASYVKIIDSILAASDLNTITSKRIREGLQRAVEYDITPQKVGSPGLAHCFLSLLTERFTDCHQNAYYGTVR